MIPLRRAAWAVPQAKKGPRSQDRGPLLLHSLNVPSPGFCQSQPDDSAIDIFRDVEGRRITAAGRDAILECRVPVHEIFDGELNADVSQILIGRPVPGVIAERQIERVIGWLDVVVVVDGAGVGSVRIRAGSADGAAWGQALEVDIRRCSLGMVEMSSVIHEKGRAPLPRAPAKPSPIFVPRPRLYDAELLHAAVRRKVVV